MNTNNTLAKSEILAAIRKNLDASAPFDAVRAEHKLHHLATVSTATPYQFSNAIVEVFCKNLESVGGKCTTAGSLNEASSIIQSIIDDLKPEGIALSDGQIVHMATEEVATWAEVLENASAAELFDCDLGITSAQWGIAETGTLVLESEKEFSRLTSLVPPVHVCILDAANIRQTMGEILQNLEDDLNPAVTFITGPSRTSDIELTLAIGVHGPRELYVIVIDDIGGQC